MEADFTAIWPVTWIDAIMRRADRKHGPAVGLGAETRRVPCPDRESVWADRGPKQKRRLKVVPLMTDPETITLRFTLIGGQRLADDYQVM
jgi:hypothetical protein